jgi:hypothetical protein
MADLDVVDMSDGLLFKTALEPLLIEALLLCAVTGAFVALVSSRFLVKWEVIVLATLSASVAFFAAKRTRRCELRIGRKEFVSRGNLGDILGPTRSVSAADVLWLEYQESRGGDSPGHPAGLYAVAKHGSVCLLPDIDEKQTASIIERIKERFPDFRAQWADHSAFGTHFISLGLSEPNRTRG